MKSESHSAVPTDARVPKTLWEALRFSLEDADGALTIKQLVRLVAESPYPGAPTRLRIRAVLRRQILFGHVAEIEPNVYELTGK